MDLPEPGDRIVYGGRERRGSAGPIYRGAWLPAAPRLALTFANEGSDLRIEALPVALPPEAHVGGVVLPAALVRGAHGEELPAIPGPEEFTLPAVQARAARPERQVVVAVVNEARVDPAGAEGLAPVPMLPGVRLVPVIGADGHSQHAEGAER